MVTCHENSWYVTIKHVVLSWKKPKHHQLSPKIFVYHEMSQCFWNIFDDIWWSRNGDFSWHFACRFLYFHPDVSKCHKVKSPKMFQKTWWLLVTCHDQSWRCQTNSQWNLKDMKSDSHLSPLIFKMGFSKKPVRTD